MKLTAEQKQLFHECVDLALEVNEKEDVPFSVNFGVNEYGILSFRVYDKKLNNFTISWYTNQLQQAKDYLTELLEK